MNKRLEMLLKLVTSPSADAFAWYALALEQRNSESPEDAVKTFEELNQRFPDYLPQYLMAGQLLLKLGRPADAKGWLARGVDLATLSGNQKTLSELESALSECA